MSKFDLEKRAEELFPMVHDRQAPLQLDQTRAMARKHAIQLARELAEAIAAEILRYNPHATGAAEIARSFARPLTHEGVMREALKRMRCTCGWASMASTQTDHTDDCPGGIAKRALDWRQP